MDVQPLITERISFKEDAMKIQKMRSRAGQGMTEYIIIVALIAIAAIAAFSYFGKTVRSQVGGMSEELAGQSADQSIKDAQDAAGAKGAAGEGKKDKGLDSYKNK